MFSLLDKKGKHGNESRSWPFFTHQPCESDLTTHRWFKWLRQFSREEIRCPLYLQQAPNFMSGAGLLSSLKLLSKANDLRETMPAKCAALPPALFSILVAWLIMLRYKPDTVSQDHKGLEGLVPSQRTCLRVCLEIQAFL